MKYVFNLPEDCDITEEQIIEVLKKKTFNHFFGIIPIGYYVDVLDGNKYNLMPRNLCLKSY